MGTGPEEDWNQMCLQLSGIEIWIAHPLIAEIGVPVWLYSTLTV